MKRGKALVIKSTERDYRVLDASRRPIPGMFTRDEAVARAKADEAWMKEQGFPRGTKHYVIYQPTGENVPFEGAMMAKRRRRRVNLRSATSQHRESFREMLASVQKTVRHAEANAHAGASCEIRFDNIVTAERRLAEAAAERGASSGRYARGKSKTHDAFYAFDRRIGEMSADFVHACLKG
jgi:hypothetical protein